jgi:ubiquinone/menaquinone biosynthesis C-methylase UbiE
MKNAEKEFFNVIANEREYDVFPDVFYAKIIQNMIKCLPHGSLIIDVGTGSGAWGIRIAQKGHIVIGIDISKEMLKNVQQDHSSDFLRVCGDAEYLPFREKMADCVFYGFSLHHIPAISQSLKEAYRCLKPGGLLVLIEPNGTNPVRRLSAIIGKLLNRVKRYHFSSPTESPLSIGFVRRLLKACKFTVIYFSVDYTIVGNEKTNALVFARNLLLKLASKMLPREYGALNFIFVARTPSLYSVLD